MLSVTLKGDAQSGRLFKYPKGHAEGLDARRARIEQREPKHKAADDPFVKSLAFSGNECAQT
jgi:hypothetical protein